MNDRNWGMLAAVFGVLTVMILLFAANNPNVQNEVSDAVRATARPTAQVQANTEETDSVVLGEEATPMATSDSDDDNESVVDEVVSDVRSAMPKATPESDDDDEMMTASPSATMRPAASPME